MAVFYTIAKVITILLCNIISLGLKRLNGISGGTKCYRPGPLPEQPVQLILLNCRDVVEFTLERFIHHLVLRIQIVVVPSKGIHVFLGLHHSCGCQSLVKKSKCLKHKN